MGIMPEEKGFSKKHPAVFTIIVIILIAICGVALKILQQTYFPAQKQEFKIPVFINETFQEVDKNFDVKSILTEKEKDVLFKNKYEFNVVKWTCRSLGCEKIAGLPTLKMICKNDGFAEDLRISMKDDCTEVEKQSETTVVFQLVSKTTDQYYLGRSGRIV